MTIGALLTRNANKFPQKTAVVSETSSLTFKELNERVNRLAHALRRRGLERGDRVGALVHNCHQFIELYFVSAKTGAIFCPYNNHLKQWELKDIINYSSPKFLFLDDDFATSVIDLRPQLSLTRTYVSLQRPQQGFMEDYQGLI